MVPNLQPKDREFESTRVRIMPLTLKKVEKAYCFGLVRPCLRPSVTSLR